LLKGHFFSTFTNSKNKTMKKVMAGIFLVTLILTSCEKDKGLWYSKNWEQEHPYGQSSTPQVCDTAGTVSYSVTVQPIINQNCALSGCHVNHAQTNYNVFANVVADAQASNAPNDIISRINSTSNPMPASGPLSACDKAKIKLWIQQGCQAN
jgi:hypothetical protein